MNSLFTITLHILLDYTQVFEPHLTAVEREMRV